MQKGKTVANYSIEWKGTNGNNFWQGRGSEKPLAIVDHIMEGSMSSSWGWFSNPAANASSHYGVAKDGRIWQFVKVEDTAWTNGVLQSPDVSLPWLAECVVQDINPNRRTISIEHEGYTGQPFPEAQYQATLWLHRYLCKTYHIPPDRKHIIGHYQITAKDRANCPGATFPWQRLMSDLNIPVIPPAFNPNPQKFSIGQGMMAELRARKLIAAHEETYYSANPGQGTIPQHSLLTTTTGELLMATQDLDEHGNPAATWQVRVFRLI